MFNRKQKKSQKKHNTSETPQKGGKNAPGDQDIGNSLRPGVSPSSGHDGQVLRQSLRSNPRASEAPARQMAWLPVEDETN